MDGYPGQYSRQPSYPPDYFGYQPRRYSRSQPPTPGTGGLEPPAGMDPPPISTPGVPVSEQMQQLNQVGRTGQVAQVGQASRAGQVGRSGRANRRVSRSGRSARTDRNQLDETDQMHQIDGMNQMGPMESMETIDSVGQMDRINQMDQMEQIDQMGQMSQINQMGQMNRIGRIGRMGQIGQIGQLGPVMNQMDQIDRIDQMDQINQIDQMDQMNQIGQMDRMGQMGMMGQMRRIGGVERNRRVGRGEQFHQIGEMRQTDIEQLPGMDNIDDINQIDQVDGINQLDGINSMANVNRMNRGSRGRVDSAMQMASVDQMNPIQNVQGSQDVQEWLYPIPGLDPVEQMEREVYNLMEPIPQSGSSSRRSTSQIPSQQPILHEPQQPATVTPAYPQRYQQWKPTSSIPPDLSSANYASQCIAAAEASRMPAFKLLPSEYNALRQYLSQRHVTTYLNIRNGILRLWLANPTVAVTMTEAAGCVRDERYYPLAEFAFQWLVRNGYINHGCFPRTNIGKLMLPVKGTKPRQTIAIVGAGISGLCAARQLEALLSIYAANFAEYEDLPRVVILEGRKRIGGRIYTPRLSSVNAKVDLGSDTVLGFGNGNPLGVVMRRQLGIPVMALDAHSSDTLYDGDTCDPMPESVDYRAHGLFNHLLDRMRQFESGMVEPPSAAGDKTLIQAGRDPSPDHGGESIETIAHVEQRTRPYTTPAPDSADDAVDLNVEVDLLRELGFSTKNGKAFTTGQPHSATSSNDDKTKNSDDTNSDDPKKFSANGKSNADAKSATDSSAHQSNTNGKLTSSKGTKIEIHAEPSGGAGSGGSLGLTMRRFVNQLRDIAELDDLDIAALDWYYAKFEFFSGDDISKQGLSSWSHHRRNRFSGRHAWARDGMAALCKGLDTVPSKLDVRFNTQVTVIEYDDDNATVGFENGDQVNADRVIVTVPLGVLKKRTLQFIPDLPQWKTNSIERLNFGVVNKVCLVFDTLFWPVDAGPLIRATAPKSEKRGECFMFQNMAKRCGGNLAVIVGLISGEAASDLPRRSDREIIDEAVNRLRKIFRADPAAQTSKLIESVVTRWQLDPLSRGSFSYVGTEGTVVDHDLLGRPVQHSLFFAGEATSRLYPGTVHGAYLSGLRVAKEVLNSLIGPLEVPENLILDPFPVNSSATPPLATNGNAGGIGAAATVSTGGSSGPHTAEKSAVVSSVSTPLGPPGSSTHHPHPIMPVGSIGRVANNNGHLQAISDIGQPPHIIVGPSTSRGSDLDDAEAELLELRRRRVAAETEEMERELVNQLGEAPVRPERIGTTNPFLLFQKDYWAICREETEAAKQNDRKGHATRNEIRVTLGKKWRSLPSSEKTPYIERSQRAKDSNEVKNDEYLRQSRWYESEADNFRQQWQQDHPSQPSIRETQLERRIDELRPRRKRIRIRE